MTDNKSKKSGMSRRRLLKGSGSSLLAVGFWSRTKKAQAATMLATEHHEVVVIGSGFGGSVTALRLTEQGIPVTIIEKGKRWVRKPGEKTFSELLPPDRRSTWLDNWTSLPLGPRLPVGKYVGVLQRRTMAGLSIMSGAAYGGGSITWGGVMVKPKEEIFSQVFPEQVSYQDLEPYYDRVARKLNRSTIPPDVLQSEPYRHIRVMKEQCDRAEIETELMPSSTDWNIVRQELRGEIPPSVIQGDSVYGVNSGGKGTTDQTYLKEAEETGLLTVKTLHQVAAIKENGSLGFIINLEKINEYGDVIAYQSITCHKLFLAAGTMGTNELLVKARAQGWLPRLSNKVGSGFGNNGNVYALRVGITESLGNDQGGPPSMGVADYNNPYAPVFMEHPQFPVGFDIRGLMYFGIGLTKTRGQFYYSRFSRKVKLLWPSKDEGQSLVNKAVLGIMDRLNAKNGGWTTSILTFFQKSVKDDAVYHPLGGCVMGEVCDFYGRVKGYRGLYVNDGSFLPGSSACANPSFTIAALAERNIEEIIDRDF